MNPFSEFAAIIGIDWADRKHDLCLKIPNEDALEYRILENKPEAIEDWANDLRQRFAGKPVAICIEFRKVPLIHALLKYDFLEQWPTLQSAKRARKTTLERFFHAHNSRYAKVIEKRIQAIKSAVPLTNDPGVIEPNRLMVVALVHQLALLLGHIDHFDDKIAECFADFDDADLFSNLPGAGKQLAPRLWVAFGEDRERFALADALCCYAGIAPVTERSGNKSWVHWRYSCPKFLRQSFIEWTNQTVRFSFWARAFYQAQREKGKTHQMAIRAFGLL